MRNPLPRVSRRGRTALLAVVCLILLFMVLGWAVDTWTNWLWYSEVHYPQVFTRLLWTRIGLFAVFGAVVGLLLAGNLVLAYRLRPPLRAADAPVLQRYRLILGPRIRLWITVAGLVVGLFAGLSAQGRWQTWMLFANAQSFGVKDPQFHTDLGFYVFRFPFWQYLVGVGFTTVVLCLLGVLAVYYLFGGVRLQGSGDRMTTAARAHLTALVASFVLLKAVAYFLDRRGLLLGHNSGTDLYGAGYADVNALLPAKEILGWISVVVAVAILVFSNAYMRSLLWPAMALGMLVVSAIAIGGVVPWVVQTFTVRPNIRDKEAAYITRSIQATRTAYGLDAVQSVPYGGTATVPPPELAKDTEIVPNIRLLDPAVVSDTFTQLQQVRRFYDFGEKLDVDRYSVGGKTQDYVVGVRELDYSRLTGTQANWQNRHTVFTHGYGFVAAPANQTVCGGQPYFVSGSLGDAQSETGKQSQVGECSSPEDQIKVDNPRIYYGEGMNDYAIVGSDQAGRSVEYDRPTGTKDQYFTYNGSGGVALNSYWRRMLYAAKFQETNFLISSTFNKNSKVMYVRDPRKRVEQVAPFLTMDGDPYPAVVDGKVLWILDGYTTSSTYPYAQRIDLRAVTNDALTGTGTFAQERQDITYLRNSVKATVDAYTGEVKLYSFNDSSPDPVLKAWNKAFGGHLIKPASQIPPGLSDHLRYPEDQFKVQRSLMSRFHVTDPKGFFSSQDFWEVPQDPSSNTPGVKQPPYYLQTRVGSQSSAQFQLVAAMTPSGRQNLAALMSGTYVNGKPSLQLLELPSQNRIPGPYQANQMMQNDEATRQAFLPLTSNKTELVYGNLLSLPFADGMLYVQPVYLKSGVENTYPLMKKVLLNYGDRVAVADGLDDAVAELVKAPPTSARQGTGTSQPGASPTPTPTTPTSPASPSAGPTGNASGSAAVQAAVNKMNKAVSDLQAAQRSGDFAAYGRALQELNDAIAEYQRAQAAAGSAGGGSSSPSPGG